MGLKRNPVALARLERAAKWLPTLLCMGQLKGRHLDRLRPIVSHPILSPFNFTGSVTSFPHVPNRQIFCAMPQLSMDQDQASDSTAVNVFDGVQRVRPLPELRTEVDDWTGVTGTQERKKRQNRLNQRAWRKYSAIGLRSIPNVDRLTPHTCSP